MDEEKDNITHAVILEYIVGDGGTTLNSWVMFESGSNDTKVVDWDGEGTIVGMALSTRTNGENVQIQVQGYFPCIDKFYCRKADEVHLKSIVDEIFQPDTE